MSTDSRPLILFLIDRWSSAAGGIQTVNRELTKAIARRSAALHCTCLVTEMSDEEKNDARQHGVDLIRFGEGRDLPSALAAHRLLTINPERVHAIVGHGRFSGPIAQQLRKVKFPAAKFVYFVHSSPLDTEHLKEYQQDNYVLQREKRLADELALAGQADLVACIGPRLTRYMKDELTSRGRADRVVRVDCGISTESPEHLPPGRPTLLSLGRTDSIGVKGLDLFALAAGHVLQKWPLNPATRDRPRPRFVVRGAKEQPEALASKLMKIGAHVSPDLNFIVRPYTTNADELQSDFSKASAFVMPSREEGFGLVACEAISSGVPVIMSKESGVAEVIRGLAKPRFIDIGPTIVDITGPRDAVARRLADAIMNVLEDESRAAERTDLLRQLLFLSCSWAAAADTLFEALFPAASRPSALPPTHPREVAMRVAGDHADPRSQPDGLQRDPKQEPQVAILVTHPLLHSRLLADLKSVKEIWCGVRRYHVGALPALSTARVWVSLIADVGNLRSAVMTTHLLSDLRPDFILLLGSVSGLEGTGVAVGDVVVANSILHHEPAPIDTTGVLASYSFVYKTPHYLEDITRRSVESRINPQGKTIDNAPRPTVHFGVVGSGNTTKLSKELRITFGVLGIESEAAGVAEAISHEGTSFVSIHSVARLLVEGKMNPEPDETAATSALGIGLALLYFILNAPDARRLLSGT